MRFAVQCLGLRGLAKRDVQNRAAVTWVEGRNEYRAGGGRERESE